jgi:hypothetical protein
MQTAFSKNLNLFLLKNNFYANENPIFDFSCSYTSFFISKTFGNTIFFFSFTPFGNAVQTAFPKNLNLFLLKNNFLCVLNHFDALILKIIFKK